MGFADELVERLDAVWPDPGISPDARAEYDAVLAGADEQVARNVVDEFVASGLEECPSPDDLQEALYEAEEPGLGDTEGPDSGDSDAPLLAEYATLGEASYRIESYDGRHSTAHAKVEKKGRLKLEARPRFEVVFSAGIRPIRKKVFGGVGANRFSGEAIDSDRVRLRISKATEPTNYSELTVAGVSADEFLEDIRRRDEIGQLLTARAAERQAASAEKSSPTSRRRTVKVSIARAAYLGGLPERTREARGNLVLDDVRIGIGTLNPKKAVVRWSECAGVTVSGGQVAKNKVGAEIAFGVLGGLGAKGAKNQAVVSVRRTDGTTAYFQVDKASPQKVRAKIAPVLHSVGVPFLDELPVPQAAAPTAPSVPTLGEQLRELAALRDEGLLTDEEFAERKARLLAS